VNCGERLIDKPSMRSLAAIFAPRRKRHPAPYHRK
jgi:hypothetical protein